MILILISLTKFTYLVGFTIAITSFGIFLYIIISEIDHVNHWLDDNDIFKPELKPQTKSEMYETLTPTPEYKLFYEINPDAGEYFHYYRDGGQLELSVTNYEKDNTLNMILSYDFSIYDDTYDEFTNIDIRCDLNIPNSRSLKSYNPSVIGFIKNVNCLDLGLDVSDLICPHEYILEENRCIFIPIDVFVPPYDDYTYDGINHVLTQE